MQTLCTEARDPHEWSVISAVTKLESARCHGFPKYSEKSLIFAKRDASSLCIYTKIKTWAGSRLWHNESPRDGMNTLGIAKGSSAVAKNWWHWQGTITAEVQPSCITLRVLAEQVDFMSALSPISPVRRRHLRFRRRRDGTG